MLHLRKDYDTIQPWPVKRPHIVKHTNGNTENIGESEMLFNGARPIINDDEPVFVLRGQDPVAAVCVRLWADLAEQAGSDIDLCRRVRYLADQMDEYAANKGKVFPDTPEGMLR